MCHHSTCANLHPASTCLLCINVAVLGKGVRNRRKSRGRMSIAMTTAAFALQHHWLCIHRRSTWPCMLCEWLHTEITSDAPSFEGGREMDDVCGTEMMIWPLPMDVAVCENMEKGGSSNSVRHSRSESTREHDAANPVCE